MKEKCIIVVLLFIFSLNNFVTASIDQFVEYSNAKLSGDSAERVISESCVFQDISIDNLTLSDAIIKSSIFSNVKLKDIVAWNITIRNSNFVNSKLNNFDLNLSNLLGVKFVSIKPKRFIKVSFDKAMVRGCRFVNVVFDTCSFVLSKISECKFEKCLFIGTDFKQTKLNDVSFKSCIFNTDGWEKSCKNFDLIGDIKDVTFDACTFFKMPNRWYNFLPEYDLWINRLRSSDKELKKFLESLGAEVINYDDVSFDLGSILKFSTKSFIGGIFTGSGMAVGNKIVKNGVSTYIPGFVKTPYGKLMGLFKRKNIA